MGRPNVADVVDLIVRLEDDPTRRTVLDGTPYDLFRAAADDDLVASDGIPDFASVVGEAVRQGLLGYRTEAGGAVLPPPEAPWTDYAFQSRSGYHSTAAGQQMAALRRQRTVPTIDAAAMARRLTGELEESEDLLGEALDAGRFWQPPRRMSHAMPEAAELPARDSAEPSSSLPGRSRNLDRALDPMWPRFTVAG